MKGQIYLASAVVFSAAAQDLQFPENQPNLCAGFGKYSVTPQGFPVCILGNGRICGLPVRQIQPTTIPNK